MESLTEHVVKPQVTPAVAQPVVPEPPDVQQRVAAQTRHRVDTQPEHAVKPPAAPAVAQPVAPKPPEVQQRVAAQARPRVESPTEHVVKPQVVPAVVQPVAPKPLDVQQRTAARREHVIVQARQPGPDIMAVELSPVAVKPVPQRRVATTPRSRTATQTTGRQAPSRVAAAVPQTVAPVPVHGAAVSQPREPTPAAVFQAHAEQEQLRAEQAALDNYKALVQQRLEGHSHILQEVIERNGMSGQAVLKFTVLSDGQIIDPQITDFVGHRSFRAAMLRVLKRVGQLPPLPPEIRRSQIPMEQPFNLQFKER